MKNGFNQKLVFPRQQRFLLYSLISAQLRAGVPLTAACEVIAGLSDLPPTLCRLARVGAQAGLEGRSVIGGLADTGMLPTIDIGVFHIAEARGTLADAMTMIEASTEQRLGFFDRVIMPNLYYASIFGILIFFAFEVEDFVTGLVFADPADNLAVRLSSWLNTWGVVVAGGLGLITMLVSYGKFNLTGRLRRALLFFDTEARYQFGIRFCSLAEMMMRNGASHMEVLDATAEVMGHSRFVYRHAIQARAQMSEYGTAFEEAIADGLLPAEHAGLLIGLVPGGRRELYPKAFRTINVMLRRTLEARYMIVQGVFRSLLLLAIMLLLITLGKGMYTLLLH